MRLQTTDYERSSIGMALQLIHLLNILHTIEVLAVILKIFELCLQNDPIRWLHFQW